MKKKWIILLIIGYVILSFTPAFAKESDNFYTGDSVLLEHKIGSTTFVAGNVIDITSEIDGASFIAGNNIMMSNIQDYAFIAGNTISLTDFYAKDAFVAGNTITMRNISVRDLYAAASTIKVDGMIGHNAYLAGENVIINAVINGDIYIDSEKIELGEKAIVNGTLKYPKTAKTTINEQAVIHSTKTYKSTTVKVSKETPKGKVLKARIISWIISYLSILLVAIVLLAIMKKFFDKVAKIETNVKEVLKRIGIGLVSLIIIPLISILIILTIIAIPLSIITLLLYGILIYVSMIPTAYYLGKKVLKDKIKNQYLLLTVSLLALYILKSIPYIGGLVGFLSLCFGFGIYLQTIKEKISMK